MENVENAQSTDILDLLSSDEKPFIKSEEPAKEEGKYNLWEDTDIPKMQFNVAHLHNVDKSFTILLHKSDAGIPPEVDERIMELCKVLLAKGFIFRYNGDDDNTYAKILKIEGGIIDTFLPWKKFNTTVTAKMIRPVLQAYKHASYYHKAFAKLPNSVRTILARDVHVLTGEDCKRPVRFVICYTPDGCETKDKIDFKTTGNLSFSITIADDINIPVFNLKNGDAVNRLVEFIKTLN